MISKWEIKHFLPDIFILLQWTSSYTICSLYCNLYMVVKLSLLTRRCLITSFVVSRYIIYIYIHIYVCVYVCIYIHIYVYIYIYIYAVSTKS